MRIQRGHSIQRATTGYITNTSLVMIQTECSGITIVPTTRTKPILFIPLMARRLKSTIKYIPIRFSSKERIPKEREYIGSYKIPSDYLKKITNPT